MKSKMGSTASDSHSRRPSAPSNEAFDLAPIKELNYSTEGVSRERHADQTTGRIVRGWSIGKNGLDSLKPTVADVHTSVPLESTSHDCTMEFPSTSVSAFTQSVSLGDALAWIAEIDGFSKSGWRYPDPDRRAFTAGNGASN
jgi:hypothetical protein